MIDAEDRKEFAPANVDSIDASNKGSVINAIMIDNCSALTSVYC